MNNSKYIHEKEYPGYIWVGNTTHKGNYPELDAAGIDYIIGDTVAYTIHGKVCGGKHSPIMIKKEDYARYNTFMENIVREIRAGRG